MGVRRLPHFCEFYLQDLDYISTVDIREKKSPSASSKRKEKGTLGNRLEHPILLKACPQEKLLKQNLTHQEYYQRLTILGQKK